MAGEVSDGGGQRAVAESGLEEAAGAKRPRFTVEAAVDGDGG